MLNLESQRRRHGWSQTKLAALVGCHHSAVSHWEAGRMRPSGIRGRRLVELLGLPLDELFTPINDNDRTGQRPTRS